jgi:prepilin-type N-terminal cleavage/methylation domain-containing protein
MMHLYTFELDDFMRRFTHWFNSRASGFRVEANTVRLNRSGFSVVELLVVMAVIVILMSITLRGLGSRPGVKDVERAAYAVTLRLETAKARAQARGEPVYWVVADSDAEPREAALSAYQFVDDVDPVPQEISWAYLPAGMVFATDPDTTDTDLFEEDPVAMYSQTGSGEWVTGSFRVMLAVYPDGSFRSGPGEQPLPVSFRVVRGEAVTAVSPPRVLPPRGELEITQAVRVSLRPLTGIAVQEVIP